MTAPRYWLIGPYRTGAGNHSPGADLDQATALEFQKDGATIVPQGDRGVDAAAARCMVRKRQGAQDAELAGIMAAGCVEELLRGRATAAGSADGAGVYTTSSKSSNVDNVTYNPATGDVTIAFKAPGFDEDEYFAVAFARFGGTTGALLPTSLSASQVVLNLGIPIPAPFTLSFLAMAS